MKLKVLFGLIFSLFCASQALTWLGQPVLDGESAILSNPVIEYVRTGQWHYPFHAHELFYPGIKVFMLHPPLHYLAASLWVRWLGVSVQSLLLQSLLVGLAGILLVSLFVWRRWGGLTSSLTVLLTLGFYGYSYSSHQLRCDIGFGFTYLCLTLLIFKATCESPTKRSLQVLSFWIGVIAVAALASHWNGFLAGPIVAGFLVYLGVRDRAQSLRPVLATLAGSALALGAWALFFGGLDELAKALIFAVAQGAQFKAIIQGSRLNTLAAYLEWPGGYWVLSGFGFFLVSRLIAFVTGSSFERSWCRDHRDSRSLEIFFLASIALYYLFYFAAVGNQSPQYGINIYFLVLPLAARGFVLAASFATQLAATFLKPKLADRLAPAALVCLLLVVFARSPMAKGNRLEMRHLDKSVTSDYAEMRETLLTYTPRDKKLVLGGNSYPYVYDLPYTSTMWLVAQYYLHPPASENLSFLELVRAHLKYRPSLNQEEMPLQAKRDILREKADVILIADNPHSWQNFFFDPAVQEPDYVRVADVFFLEPPSAITPLDATREYFNSLFVRRSLVPDWKRKVGCETGCLRIGRSVAVFIQGQEPPPVLLSDWLQMSEPMKTAQVLSSLKFQFPRLETHLASGDTTLLAALVATVDTYAARTASPNSRRHLSDGLSYAITRIDWRDVTGLKE